MQPCQKLFCVLWLNIFLLPGLLHAEEWSFSVWLDKQNIGTHQFSLQDQRLSSRASFKVKVLFINAYRYQHQADETWQGECLQSLQAHTEENKEITDVSGRLSNGQFVVSKNKSMQTLPACVMTFAYWNPKILQQSKLLNPQNAEYLDVTVADEGTQSLNVRGADMQTHQYRLTGRFQGKIKLNITLWYDEQQRWVGLKSITPEGYTITYKLI
ncbi:DUF6134 family protein [Methylophilus aquaticus]|uniref:DUF6134 family protein n=1 Tax=Methylophilus aquaticus TaxID=1971610 RepID=A0ABT9JUN6_9PROT|nr:DUF6134 family protein [Methylophilus aquaticus]MDP8567805.1 DUF6134 family protein [Methylophilus aquaticus]